ncbi:protein phosphatase 1 regulatory subunit 35-like [Manacus candei]|uniref:protein phosphatase 1 regulatory subunit 35-like n=1 Tax=Manacus candei TaxID=415023 RepID=UPI0022276CDD|nr:protein phosphatase 1 regulatory subunit 35-like [Manacus candei]
MAILPRFLPGAGHSRQPRGRGVWGRGLAELMSAPGGGSDWAAGDFAAANPPPSPPPPTPAPSSSKRPVPSNSQRCKKWARGRQSRGGAPGHRPGRARHVGAEARPSRGGGSAERSRGTAPPQPRRPDPPPYKSRLQKRGETPREENTSARCCSLRYRHDIRPGQRQGVGRTERAAEMQVQEKEEEEIKEERKLSDS